MKYNGYVVLVSETTRPRCGCSFARARWTPASKNSDTNMLKARMNLDEFKRKIDWKAEMAKQTTRISCNMMDIGNEVGKEI